MTYHDHNEMAASAQARLRRMISDALAETGFDTSKALEKTWSRLLSDESMFRELAAPMIRNKLSSTLHDVLNERRAAVAQATSPVVGTGAAKVDPVKPKPAKSHPTPNPPRPVAPPSIYDWPIESGKPLGSATKSEVASSAAGRLRMAETVGRRGRFEMCVAEAMTEAGTVREQLNEDRLQAFVEQVGGLD